MSIYSNGVHIHMSFRDKDGKPSTYDPDGPCGMASATAAFAAGVHVNAIGGDCPGKTELDKTSSCAQTYTPNTPRKRASRATSSNCPRTIR